MRGNLLACAIAVGLVVVVIVTAPESQPRAAKQAPRVEVPWLSREAAAQLFGEDGEPGPLFTGIELGGPAPSRELRAKIAEFGRANHVQIDLELRDDELVAIRLGVTYGGCCGYEGADVLALRLHRPKMGGGCLCGEPWSPDDWAFHTGDVHARIAVRVGHVAVRWERDVSLAELVERTDQMIGMRVADVREAAGDRWIEVEPGRRYLLEMPGTAGYLDGCWSIPIDRREDLGAYLTVEHGKVSEVTFIADVGEDAQPELRARWGRPRERDGKWTWRLRDRIVTADTDSRSRITIAAR